MTALSTCEAEYVAMVDGAKSAIGIKHVFEEMGFLVKKIILFGDNQGAISLAEAARVTKRSKHVQVRYHWIREQIANGVMELKYVQTDQQIADCLTKPLSKMKFNYFRSKMVKDMPTV